MTGGRQDIIRPMRPVWPGGTRATSMRGDGAVRADVRRAAESGFEHAGERWAANEVAERLAAARSAPLVSVIIPCYNSAAHIEGTLESVRAQTMGDLEILVVDDCSRDGSVGVVQRVAARDSRLRLFRQSTNQGVARARNRALAQARGRYIAYLDSDDLWAPEKLERQIAFMAERGIGACFTSYETIEQDGTHRNFIHVPRAITYRQFLKNTVTCSHSLLFDTELVDRSLLVMPDIRRGQDFATWVQVMKAGHTFFGLDEPLAKYRKCAGSLSSNPLTSVRRTWNIYRNVEHLSIPYAAYCQAWQLYHAIIKRIGGM